MTFETNLISAFLNCPRSPDQQNAPYTSDAEIVTIGDTLMAVTVDEFSAEDGLGSFETDPRIFGQNLAIAGLSDLLAVGARPRFWCQSIGCPADRKPAWLHEFTTGLTSVLNEAGCFIIGGDSGATQNFRLTATAIGDFESNRHPVTRILNQPAGILAVSGSLGTVNHSALKGSPVELNYRGSLSQTMNASAYACIDTSDGLITSLEMLQKVNPSTTFKLNLETIPYPAGMAIDIPIPKETSLFGAAGEYELLYCLPKKCDLPDGLTVIGSFHSADTAEIILENSTTSITYHPHNLDPRVLDRDTYITELIRFVCDLLGADVPP